MLTYRSNGKTLKIYRDLQAPSPRSPADLSTLALHHPSHDLLDETNSLVHIQGDWSEVDGVICMAHDIALMRPVYMVEAVTRIELSVYPPVTGHRSDMVGFSFVLAQQATAAKAMGMGANDLGGIMEKELAEYVAWVNGDTYTYELTDSLGSQLGGVYYGTDMVENGLFHDAGWEHPHKLTDAEWHAALKDFP